LSLLISCVGIVVVVVVVVGGCGSAPLLVELILVSCCIVIVVDLGFFSARRVCFESSECKMESFRFGSCWKVGKERL